LFYPTLRSETEATTVFLTVVSDLSFLQQVEMYRLYSIIPLLEEFPLDNVRDNDIIKITLYYKDIAITKEEVL